MKPLLKIENCDFQELVRINDLKNGPSVVFVDCKFYKGVSLKDATCTKSLFFINCVFDQINEPVDSTIALDLENTTIDGDLILWNCKLGGRLFAPSLCVNNDFRIRGCRIAENLNHIGECIRFDEMNYGTDSHESGAVSKLLEYFGWSERSFKYIPAVTLDGASIAGDFEITLAIDESKRTSKTKDLVSISYGKLKESNISVICGQISARGVNIGGDVELFGTLCYGGGIDFENAEIGGNVSFFYSSSTVGGKYYPSVYFRTSSSDNSFFRPSISFHRVKIIGYLDLRMSEVEDTIDLYQSTIQGNIAFEGLYAGHLNMVFTKINGMCTAKLTHVFSKFKRKSLHIDGDLILSGSEIKGLEFYGTYIKKDIRIVTGKFDRLFFDPGVEFSRNEEERFIISYCQARSVEIHAVTVQERASFTGIKIGYSEEGFSESKTPKFVFRDSFIGADLTFFRPERDLNKYAQEIWFKPVNWIEGKEPTPLNIKSIIDGELRLTANSINGNLDLRNVEVAQKIDLKDTKVQFLVNLGWKLKIKGYEEFDLKTSCAFLDAQNLQSDGDIDLSGLKVSKEGGVPNADLVSLESDKFGVLNGRNIQARGDLLFKSKEENLFGNGINTKSKNGYEFGYAFIEGNLDLTSGTANHLVISGDCLPDSKASLSLERCTFSRLEIVDPTPAPINLSKLSVNKWVFGSKVGNRREDHAEDYIKVLENMEPFDRSTWIEVETDLRNRARDRDANLVYVTMRKEERRKQYAVEKEKKPKFTDHPIKFLRITSLMWIKYIWSSLVNLTVAYGTKPERPLLWLSIPLFLISWLFIFPNEKNIRASSEFLEVLNNVNYNFSDMESDRFLGSEASGIDSTSTVEDRLTGKSTFMPGYQIIYSEYFDQLEIQPKEEDWGYLDSFILSIRYHVPLIPTLTHNRWEASRSDLNITGLTSEQYANVISLIHWIIWPISLIGFGAKIYRGKND